MATSPISTEPQRIALEVIGATLDRGIEALMEELLAPDAHTTPGAADRAHVIKLRMDALFKVKQFLVEPVIEEYAYLERSGAEMRPGDLPAMWEERDRKFLQALKQGI